MRQPILVIARQSATLLGLAQAVLKFGYQMVTAYPDEAEIARAERMGPALVVVRPPAEPSVRLSCLRIVKTRFQDRAIPILACVSSPEEEGEVRAILGSVPVLVGSPLRLNDLYLRMQELFDLAKRRELRIRTELAVAHREVGLQDEDRYRYDTLCSLSRGGGFIATRDPYPVGTPVELVFCVGVASRSLKLRGRVVRHGTVDPGKETGMGITFDRLPEDAASLLESYLVTQLGSLDLPVAL